MFDYIEMELPMRRQEIQRFLKREEQVRAALAAQAEQRQQPSHSLARFIQASNAARLAGA